MASWQNRGQQYTQSHEGYRDEVYLGPEVQVSDGKGGTKMRPGKPTVGWGTETAYGGDAFADAQIGQVFPRDVLDKAFVTSYGSAEESARSLFPNFDNFTDDQKIAVTDMAYQMGVTGLGGFQNLINEAKKPEYDPALMAHHIEDSLHAKQTPTRNAELRSLVQGTADWDFIGKRHRNKLPKGVVGFPSAAFQDEGGPDLTSRPGPTRRSIFDPSGLGPVPPITREAAEAFLDGGAELPASTLGAIIAAEQAAERGEEALNPGAEDLGFTPDNAMLARLLHYRSLPASEFSAVLENNTPAKINERYREAMMTGGDTGIPSGVTLGEEIEFFKQIGKLQENHVERYEEYLEESLVNPRVNLFLDKLRDTDGNLPPEETTSIPWALQWETFTSIANESLEGTGFGVPTWPIGFTIGRGKDVPFGLPQWVADHYWAYHEEEGIGVNDFWGPGIPIISHVYEALDTFRQWWADPITTPEQDEKLVEQLNTGQSRHAESFITTAPTQSEDMVGELVNRRVAEELGIDYENSAQFLFDLNLRLRNSMSFDERRYNSAQSNASEVMAALVGMKYAVRLSTQGREDFDNLISNYLHFGYTDNEVGMTLQDSLGRDTFVKWDGGPREEYRNGEFTYQPFDVAVDLGFPGFRALTGTFSKALRAPRGLKMRSRYKNRPARVPVDNTPTQRINEAIEGLDDAEAPNPLQGLFDDLDNNPRSLENELLVGGGELGTVPTLRAKVRSALLHYDETIEAVQRKIEEVAEYVQKLEDAARATAGEHLPDLPIEEVLRVARIPEKQSVVKILTEELNNLKALRNKTYRRGAVVEFGKETAENVVTSLAISSLWNDYAAEEQARLDYENLEDTQWMKLLAMGVAPIFPLMAMSNPTLAARLEKSKKRRFILKGLARGGAATSALQEFAEGAARFDPDSMDSLEIMARDYLASNDDPLITMLFEGILDGTTVGAAREQLGAALEDVGRGTLGNVIFTIRRTVDGVDGGPPQVQYFTGGGISRLDDFLDQFRHHGLNVGEIDDMGFVRVDEYGIPIDYYSLVDPKLNDILTDDQLRTSIVADSPSAFKGTTRLRKAPIPELDGTVTDPFNSGASGVVITRDAGAIPVEIITEDGTTHRLPVPGKDSSTRGVQLSLFDDENLPPASARPTAAGDELDQMELFENASSTSAAGVNSNVLDASINASAPPRKKRKIKGATRRAGTAPKTVYKNARDARRTKGARLKAQGSGAETSETSTEVKKRVRGRLAEDHPNGVMRFPTGNAKLIKPFTGASGRRVAGSPAYSVNKVGPGAVWETSVEISGKRTVLGQGDIGEAKALAQGHLDNLARKSSGTPKKKAGSGKPDQEGAAETPSVPNKDLDKNIRWDKPSAKFVATLGDQEVGRFSKKVEARAALRERLESQPPVGRSVPEEEASGLAARQARSRRDIPAPRVAPPRPLAGKKSDLEAQIKAARRALKKNPATAVFDQDKPEVLKVVGGDGTEEFVVVFRKRVQNDTTWNARVPEGGEFPSGGKIVIKKTDDGFEARFLEIVDYTDDNFPIYEKFNGPDTEVVALGKDKLAVQQEANNYYLSRAGVGELGSAYNNAPDLQWWKPAPNASSLQTHTLVWRGKVFGPFESSTGPISSFFDARGFKVEGQSAIKKPKSQTPRDWLLERSSNQGSVHARILGREAGQANSAAVDQIKGVLGETAEYIPVRDVKTNLWSVVVRPDAVSSNYPLMRGVTRNGLSVPSLSLFKSQDAAMSAARTYDNFAALLRRLQSKGFGDLDGAVDEFLKREVASGNLPKRAVVEEGAAVRKDLHKQLRILGRGSAEVKMVYPEVAIDATTGGAPSVRLGADQLPLDPKPSYTSPGTDPNHVGTRKVFENYVRNRTGYYGGKVAQVEYPWGIDATALGLRDFVENTLGPSGKVQVWEVDPSSMIKGEDHNSILAVDKLRNKNELLIFSDANAVARYNLDQVPFRGNRSNVEVNAQGKTVDDVKAADVTPEEAQGLGGADAPPRQGAGYWNHYAFGRAFEEDSSGLWARQDASGKPVVSQPKPTEEPGLGGKGGAAKPKPKEEYVPTEKDIARAITDPAGPNAEKVFQYLRKHVPEGADTEIPESLKNTPAGTTVGIMKGAAAFFKVPYYAKPWSDDFFGILNSTHRARAFLSQGTSPQWGEPGSPQQRTHAILMPALGDKVRMQTILLNKSIQAQGQQVALFRRSLEEVEELFEKILRRNGNEWGLGAAQSIEDALEELPEALDVLKDFGLERKQITDILQESRKTLLDDYVGEIMEIKKWFTTDPEEVMDPRTIADRYVPHLFDPVASIVRQTRMYLRGEIPEETMLARFPESIHPQTRNAIRQAVLSSSSAEGADEAVREILTQKGAFLKNEADDWITESFVAARNSGVHVGGAYPIRPRQAPRGRPDVGTYIDGRVVTEENSRFSSAEPGADITGTYDTIRYMHDELGFVPITYNPITAFRIQSDRMSEFISRARLVRQLEEQGLIRRMSVEEYNQTVNFGQTLGNKETFWHDIGAEMRDMFTWSAQPRKGDVSGATYSFYADPKTSLLLRNHFGFDQRRLIRKGAFEDGEIYDTSVGPKGLDLATRWRKTNNFMNMYQLGLSAFHLGTMTLEASIHSGSLAINKGGHFLRGLGTRAQLRAMEDVDAMRNLSSRKLGQYYEQLETAYMKKQGKSRDQLTAKDVRKITTGALQDLGMEVPVHAAKFIPFVGMVRSADYPLRITMPKQFRIPFGGGKTLHFDKQEKGKTAVGRALQYAFYPERKGKAGKTLRDNQGNIIRTPRSAVGAIRAVDKHVLGPLFTKAFQYKKRFGKDFRLSTDFTGDGMFWSDYAPIGHVADQLYKGILPSDQFDPTFNRLVGYVAAVNGRPAGYRAEYRKVFDNTFRDQWATLQKENPNSNWANFAKLVQKKKGMLPLEVMTEGIEDFSRYLFERIVPQVKLSSYMDLARYEVMKLGKGISPDVLESRLNRAWDSIDNRMGQMVYDRLVLNRTFRDILMLVQRAPGWNWGTKREVFGGMFDAGRFVGLKSQRGGARLGKALSAEKGKRMSAFMGEDGLPKSMGGVDEFTPRMSYVMSQYAAVPMYGAMYQYMMTGTTPEWDEELGFWENYYNFVFPLTGRVVNGQYERASFPTNQKDMMAFFYDMPWSFFEVLSHKAAPAFGGIKEAVQGQTFGGVDIYDAADSLPEKIVKGTAHVVESGFTPFGLALAHERLLEEHVPFVSVMTDFSFGMTRSPKKMWYTPSKEVLFRNAWAQNSEESMSIPEHRRMKDLKEIKALATRNLMEGNTESSPEMEALGQAYVERWSDSRTEKVNKADLKRTLEDAAGPFLNPHYDMIKALKRLRGGFHTFEEYVEFLERLLPEESQAILQDKDAKAAIRKFADDAVNTYVSEFETKVQRAAAREAARGVISPLLEDKFPEKLKSRKIRSVLPGIGNLKDRPAVVTIQEQNLDRIRQGR